MDKVKTLTLVTKEGAGEVNVNSPEPMCGKECDEEETPRKGESDEVSCETRRDPEGLFR